MAVCFSGGTQWRCWLRQCATIRKVAVSIPDGVTGIFHWHSPSDHTMALGWTQHLRGRTARRPDNLTTFVCCLSWNLGTSTFRNPLGKIRVCLLIFFHSSETQLLTYYSTRCEDHSTNIHHMWKKLSFWRKFFYLISAAYISNIIQHIKLREEKKLHSVTCDCLNTLKFHCSARDRHTNTRGARQPREQVLTDLTWKIITFRGRVWL